MSEITAKLLRAQELFNEGPAPFDSPYPTPGCFSSNDVVRMYRLGALRRDVDHIKSCDPCSDRLEKFSRVMAQPAALTAAAQGNWLARLLGHGQGEPATAHALVHVTSACSVVDARLTGPASVQLVAGPVSDLKGVTVRIGGALRGEIIEWSSNGAGFQTIDLRSLKVSNEIVQNLKDHKQVKGQVTFEAVGDSSDKPGFTATAEVEFKRASTIGV